MKFLLTTIFLTLTTISQGQEILWDSTFVVENISFKIIAGRTDSSNYAQIVRDKVDTTTIDGVNGNIEVVHFNSDDYPDIILTYLSNVPINDLYLFDPKTKAYREIDNMQEFPEAKRLESNDSLYYSYQRAGCADMKWISHLFKIKNDTATKIGTIHGQGCENDTRQKIEILNVVTLDKIYVIETLPIDTITEFQDYKWGFIKDYWNNNFEKFEK